MDPDSAVSEVQRRIELQSPEDLTFLITNVRNAAAVYINDAFPHPKGPDGKGDPLRTQIDAIVNEFINRIFSLAAPNLSINGLPVDPSSFLSTSSATPTAHEPFDARKRTAVANLITQEEKLLEDVASLKRSDPAKVAAEHAERIRAGMRRDEEDLRLRVETAAASATREGNVEVEKMNWKGDVEGGFRGAAAGLGRLKRDLPAVVARMERARMAGEYVVSKGRR